MAIAITVPRLGWNMEEGTFVGWLKQEGEHVKSGDVLFTLEGEKATEDIESLEQGILRIGPASPCAGDKVAVGAVIGFLAKPGEEVAFEAVAREPEPAAATVSAPVREQAVATPRGPTISPRARRAAHELGIDPTRLRGTGRTGRIRERDVRAAANQAPSDRSPIGATRRTIAERMTTSLRSTAPVTLTTSADASNLVNLREQFKAVKEVLPSYTDFLLKLVAVALARHPTLNSRWEGEEIVTPRNIDIGIAVDTESGLLVPVIRDVPGLGLRQLAATARDLVDRARRGALQASEMRGGTFTLTSLGTFGIDAFTPIINYPQCAILGIGRIERRPVIVAEQVKARDQVVLSLTFDHRIVDGAPAARFLQTVGQLLENPGPWLTS